MGVHDQLFKRLFRDFFGDLLHLTLPGLAGRLETDRRRFLSGELFSDRIPGELRRVDLAVEVEGRAESPGTGVVHVEVERESGSGMGERMWEYARLLHQRRPGEALLSLVVYLRRGPGPATIKRTLRRHFWGEEMERFHYFVFSIARQSARLHLRRPEPLAWALAALMDPGSWSRERHRAECVRRIWTADHLSTARKLLLTDCVNIYLKLEGDAQMRYEEAMRPAANELFDENGVYWVDKLKAEAIEEGLEEGLKEGLKEGLEKGVAKGRREGAREVLLRQLERRFGPLDRAVEERVRAIDSLDRLEALADRVLDADGLEDLGLAD